MRINVYAQELTHNIEIVSVTAENTGATFVGLRFYLESPDCLKPPQHLDDDSSAVTFWVPSKKSGFQRGDEKFLVDMLQKGIAALNQYSDEQRAA